MVKPLALFLIAATAGYLAGRPDGNETAPSASAHPREASAKQKRERWEVQDFSEWISSPVKNPEDRMPVTAPPDLSEWSAQELHAALDAAMGPGMTTLSQKEWYQLVRLLMEEWASRDFDAVAGWFESMPSAEMQRTVDGILGGVWPLERGEEALDFVIRNGLNNTVKGGISYPIFLSKAMSSAAAKSPQELAKLVAKAAANGMDSRYSSNVQFPEGFDFAALASQPELADLIANRHVFFAGEWASRDFQGAFETLAEKAGRVDSAILSSLLTEAMRRHERGDSAMLTENYTWLAEKASGMDPETGGKFVDGITKEHRFAQSSATELGSFVGNLTDSELRIKAARQAAAQVLEWNLGNGQVLPFLERTGPPEERLATLRAVMVDKLPYRFGGLSTNEEAMFRERLASWGIAAEQTDQLFSDIKAARNRR